MRGRNRSKGRCELSEEREEKEVKIKRKLNAESAEHESISDTDIVNDCLCDSLVCVVIHPDAGRQTDLNALSSSSL